MATLNGELAYLAGALRDGTVVIRSGYDYEVRLAQKSREWLEVLSGLFARNFERSGSIYREKRRGASGAVRTYYVLRIFDKRIVGELIRLFDIATPQTRWGTPDIIRRAGADIVKHYVRG